MFGANMSGDDFDILVENYLKKHMDSILKVSSFFEKQDMKDSITIKSSEKSDEVRKACNRLFVGKHSRGKEDHTMILALYSKSIALAPKDSEELALAYSNRSVLLKHLNLPEKSLIDINRALEITKSDNLKLKLLARKTECLKLNDEQDKDNFNKDLKPSEKIGGDKQFLLVTPSQQKLKFPVFTPSQKIPCAAESVTIAYNDSIGRHLIATRDIKPGEVIVVEEGYAIFPKIKKIYLFCSHCLTFAWNGIPCDNCALALYCSEDSKKKAWDEYHEVECFILPYLLSKPFEFANVEVIIMTARFFIRAVKSEGLENVLADSRMIDDVDGLHMKGLLSNGIYDNKKFKFCYNLLTHEEHTKSKIPAQDFYGCLLLDKYKIISDGDLRIQNLTNPAEVLEIKITLIKITNIIAVNCHTFQGSLCDCNLYANCNDTCTGKRGQIFSSCSSLINHSCHPNISRMFMPQRKIVIFTTCPVKKGEQLCDTYGPTVRYYNKIRRQQYLQNNYNFTCKCQACREDWSIKLSKSVLTCFKRLDPKWYKNRYLKADAVQDWPYNEKTMKDVVKASELAYNSFDQNTAYVLSIPCRDYIDQAFYKFYEDDCHVPDKC